jgi:CYTH domain-containing protein
MEIERKFLVKSLPNRWKAAPNSRIRQGYFPLRGKGIEIRVREKASEYFITIKSGHGRARLEEEIKISKSCFGALWPLVRATSVTKTRYRITYGKKTVEMDVYDGAHRGLVTADVEFRSRRDADAFEGPVWLGREITGSQKYANQALARRGHL